MILDYGTMDNPDDLDLLVWDLETGEPVKDYNRVQWADDQKGEYRVVLDDEDPARPGFPIIETRRGRILIVPPPAGFVERD